MNPLRWLRALVAFAALASSFASRPAAAHALDREAMGAARPTVMLEVERLPVYASKSGQLTFRAAPGGESAALRLAQHADEDRAAVATLFGRDWDGVTEVRVAAPSGALLPLVPPDRFAPPWAAGVAFPEKNLVVLRADSDLARERATLRHELSHVAAGRLAPGGLPRWFLEGLANLQSREPYERGGPGLVRAALTNNLLDFDQLADRFPAEVVDVELAYLQSTDFVQFMADRHGPLALETIVRTVVGGRSFELAVYDHLGERLRVLEDGWKVSLQRWDNILRFVGGAEVLWLLTTALFLVAALRLRQRRREGYERLAAEEVDEERQRLLQWLNDVEAPWADGTPDDGDARPLLTAKALELPLEATPAPPAPAEPPTDAPAPLAPKAAIVEDALEEDEDEEDEDDDDLADEDDDLDDDALDDWDEDGEDDDAPDRGPAETDPDESVPPKPTLH